MKFYDPVYSYVHVDTPHFFLGKLDKTVPHAPAFVCKCQQPFLNQQKEKNDSGNYFMFNLHGSIGQVEIELTPPGSAFRLAVARSNMCHTNIREML